LVEYTKETFQFSFNCPTWVEIS